VGAARLPGCPRSARRLLLVAAPNNAGHYRLIVALARRHARLSVAARGEVLAPSRALHVGVLEHDLSRTIFGETPGLNENFGSLIYVEALRDVATTRPAICGSLEEVMSETVPHEVGHQFGLRHEPAGTNIMSQGCKLPHYFSSFALGEIRWKGAQR